MRTGIDSILFMGPGLYYDETVDQFIIYWQNGTIDLCFHSEIKLRHLMELPPILRAISQIAYVGEFE